MLQIAVKEYSETLALDCFKIREGFGQIHLPGTVTFGYKNIIGGISGSYGHALTIRSSLGSGVGTIWWSKNKTKMVCISAIIIATMVECNKNREGDIW